MKILGILLILFVWEVVFVRELEDETEKGDWTWNLWSVDRCSIQVFLDDKGALSNPMNVSEQKKSFLFFSERVFCITVMIIIVIERSFVRKDYCIFDHVLC